MIIQTLHGKDYEITQKLDDIKERGCKVKILETQIDPKNPYIITMVVEIT